MMLAKSKLTSQNFNAMNNNTIKIKRERVFVLLGAFILMAGVFVCQSFWTIEDIPDGKVDFNTMPLQMTDYACKVLKLATIDVYMTWNFIDLFRYFLAKKEHHLVQNDEALSPFNKFIIFWTYLLTFLNFLQSF